MCLCFLISLALSSLPPIMSIVFGTIYIDANCYGPLGETSIFILNQLPMWHIFYGSVSLILNAIAMILEKHTGIKDKSNQNNSPTPSATSSLVRFVKFLYTLTFFIFGLLIVNNINDECVRDAHVLWVVTIIQLVCQALHICGDTYMIVKYRPLH